MKGGLLSQHGVVELANSVADDGKSMLPDPLKMGVFVCRSLGPSIYKGRSCLPWVPRRWRG